MNVESYKSLIYSLNVEPYMPLKDSLQRWVSELRETKSLENQNYQKLDTLIEKVDEVPFESGFCKDLRHELSELQKVVKKLDKGGHKKQLLKKIEKVKEHIFPEKVTDRLALCSKIAAQGGLASLNLNANFDKLGFFKDLQNCSSPEDRLALCKEIEKQEADALNILEQNFEKIGFFKDLQNCSGPEDRLALCKEIVAQLQWAAHHLAEHFDKLGFLKDLENCSGPEDRLALCKKIVAQLRWAAGGLAKNFDKLGLEEAPVSDRLDLCKVIAAQGVSAAKALVENFDKLGLEEATVSDRLGLCKEIAKQGDYAARALAENFEKLGLKEAPVSDRLDLCNEIAAHEGWAVNFLVKNFDKLGFLEDLQNCHSLEERFELCNDIAKQGVWAERGLAENFDKLGFLTDFQNCRSPKDRFKQCKEIAKQGMWAVRSLAENFDKLGFLEDLENCSSLIESLDLCKEIAAQGGWAAEGLVDNFDELGLKKAAVSERLALCNKIAAQGNDAAAALAENFEKLGLEEAAVPDRLALCNKIAAQGNDAACALAENFDKLGLEEAAVSDRLALCNKIAAQGNDAAEALAAMLETLEIDDSEKRQILFELLTLPSQLRDESGSLQGQKYVSKLKPFVSLLLQEDNAIDSDEFKEFDQRIAKTPIKSLHQEIKGMKAHHRLQLSQWEAYTAGVLFDLEKEKIEAIETSNILDCIYKHRIPSNRFAFVRQLRSLEPKDLKMPDLEFGTGKNAMRRQQQSQLSWILLSRMKQVGFFNSDVERESIESILTKIKGIKGFLDTKKFDFLVQLLLLAIDESPYTQEEIVMIEKAISNVLTKEQLSKKEKKGKARRKKGIKEISNKLHGMSNIWKLFGKGELISCLESERDFQPFFQEKFQTLFELEELDNLGERYQKTFGSFRDKTALFSFLRSVESLPPDDREKVKKAFTAYVDGVLRKTFPSIRYDVDSNHHLKFLFEGREELKKIWLEGKEPQKVAKAEKSTSLQKDYKVFFKEKILTDRHLNPGEFPYLRDYLQRKEGKPEMPEKLDEPKVKFQALAIALCEGEKKAEDFVSEVKKLNLSLGEFKNDLRALVPQKSFGEYKISESDDPCDLLLIGTEIQGSCQRVNGSPEVNKCLPGYMMNGEIRPIVVKRGDKLVARSLLRLMWDDKNNTPVLLQERLYSNVQDEAIKEAIQAWAVEKAKKMKIPLVSKEIGDGKSYNGTVKFLGGFAPFVYSDASGGVMSGAFETTGSHLLYLPPMREVSVDTASQSQS